MWYAWPQFFYSLFILFDIIRTFFPQLMPYLDPITQFINLERDTITWWLK